MFSAMRVVNNNGKFDKIRESETALHRPNKVAGSYLQATLLRVNPHDTCHPRGLHYYKLSYA